MKNCAPFFIAIASIFSFNCFAQDDLQASAVIATNETTLSSNQPIVSYHVVERINTPYGANITTYTVSNLSLVSTIDLGPNNSRVITPKYATAKIGRTPKSKVETLVATAAPASVSENKVEEVAIVAENKNAVLENNDAPIAIETAAIAEERIGPQSVNINLLDTYERVLEKGYRSEKMLKSVGNGHFFEGDLTLAAKWYTELFDLKTELEPIYYYRYAKSLAAISQTKKANEMMKIFEIKNR